MVYAFRIHHQTVPLTPPEDILGNTYLAIYFVISHEEADLEKSLKAYHKAVCSHPTITTAYQHRFEGDT